MGGKPAPAYGEADIIPGAPRNKRDTNHLTHGCEPAARAPPASAGWAVRAPSLNYESCLGGLPPGVSPKAAAMVWSSEGWLSPDGRSGRV